jgi:hypothetical protein
MSRLREHLTKILAKKVEAYGIVVWVDAHGEYGPEVVRALSPASTNFAAWRGSWYRLRREVEDMISQPNPPRLLIYQGVATPDPDDPLAEVRDAGTEFKTRLRTLVRDALDGVLTPSRVAEVAEQARTLEEAEAAVAGGEGLEVRLQAVLGTGDPLQLALRILADASDELLDAQNLWQDARRFLARTFGGEPGGRGNSLRDAVVRHLLLVEIEDALDGLPGNLADRRPQADRDQRRRLRELLEMWRRDLGRIGSYRERALSAESALGLNQALVWNDSLAELDSVPEIEHLALRHLLGMLAEERAEDAAALAARRRKGSLWVRRDVPEAETWEPLWRAAEALAQLRAELARTPVPRQGSSEDLLRWYADGAWRVDQAHRHLEAALTEVPTYGELDGAVKAARGAYEAWLEELLERFTTALEKEGMEPVLPRQTSIHKDLLSRSDEATAYFFVDALRYELARELADSLRGIRSDVEAMVTPAVASAPTITPVGMASLLPRAERGVRLALSARGALEVSIDGSPVRNVQDRVGLLRAAHGEVADLLLTEVFDWGEEDLRTRIGSAPLVVVRSQEIDEVFESDHTAAAWRYVKEIRTLIVRAVARLAAAGVGRFVISADHGFLILSRRLGAAREIDPPGGEGELHRRCWIGRGGAASESALRLSLASVGTESDLDLIVPRGLAVFRAGGARRFFHGGVSPQELLVPVITVRMPVVPAHPRPTVGVEVAGNRISTGVFSATLTLPPNLFAEELRVRMVARDRAGRDVARPVAGEGFEEQAGSVRLAGAERQVVTFRITESLPKGERVTVDVYDVETDRLLAKSRPAEVVTLVTVGDELD